MENILLNNSKIKLEKLSKISNSTLNTLINIEASKGISFTSEEEIAKHISKVYNISVTSDQVADLFALEREIEDKKINLKFINY